MRFGKTFLCLLTAVFVMVAVFAGEKEDAPDGFLSVDVLYGHKTENIACWETGNDYYLYLPGSADLSRMQLRFGGDEPCTLNGQPLTDRMSCEQFQLNVEYELAEEGEVLGTLTFLRSTGVAAMYVDVASGNMDHIHGVKGNQESGKLRLYSPEGQLSHDGVVTAINGRGNSTWKEEKKSYSLELASEGNLLNMGSAKKWVLLSNIYDLSNLRNKIVYDFAKDLGLAYSPDCDWVDLYLNGEYYGLYLLCERNEVHPQRVDLPQQNSFLVSRDAQWRFEEQGRPFLTTESQAALRIYHAGMDANAMQTFWQSAENAILREDGVDPITGKRWDQLIDTESWVKKYLIDEVFGNKDGTALSQFYYYDGSDGTGKIHAGPVWDYDLTMSVDKEDPAASASMFFANIPGIHGSAWPDALYRKTEFYDSIVAVYETRFLPLLNTYLETNIPAFADRIRDASAMNAVRWGFVFDDWRTEEIQEFLTHRMAFLEDIWLEDAEYCLLNAVDESMTRKIYAVKQGSLPPELLSYESGDSDHAYVWYHKGTNEPFDLNAPVYADAEIILRYERITEETQPPQTQPKETVSADVPVEESRQEEGEAEIPGERPSLLRLMPVLLFAGALAMVLVAGIWQILRDRRG